MGHGAPIPLRPGIYSPVMTFFHPETEDIDTATCAQHAVRLADAGLQGLVTLGSNGEAVHLTREERTLVTQTVRRALDDALYAHLPVIAGCSEQSVRGTIELCTEAQRAGASYALVLAPSYFRAAMDGRRIREFFTSVADGSPVPVLVYNYPGAVAGIDLDSDLLIELSKHPNIVGTKFTCGNTGKLTRVAAATDAAGLDGANSGYMAFGGMADFTLQTALSGGSGIIAGGANVVPRACVRVWTLAQQGNVAEAARLQKMLSQGDWVLTKAAVPGTKKAIELFWGYGGDARRPLPRLSEDEADELRHALSPIMAVETYLTNGA